MYFSSAICVYTQLNQKIPLLEEKIKLGAEMFRHWVLHDISSLVFSCLCFQLQTIQLQVVEKSGVENSRVEVFG